MTSQGQARERRLGWTPILALVLAQVIFFALTAAGADLAEIRQRGVLRHLGVPYANFVNGPDGLDMELTQLFAASLKVRYEYVATDWSRVLGDLTGKEVKPKGEEVVVLKEVPIRGDIAASGITVIPWRKKVVTFSRPVFPTQVWLVAKAKAPLNPIKPTGQLEGDIDQVKKLLAGQAVYCKEQTCLDPSLYNIAQTGARCQLFAGALNDLAPAVIQSQTDLSLLDVPDTLVALEKWPGEIKVIGPISPVQDMAAAFRLDAPELAAAYNRFLEEKKRDGTYRRLVEKYYPFVQSYFPSFFDWPAPARPQ